MLKPPAVKKIPFSFILHNKKHTDDYQWLQNIQDPAVQAYLQAENAYADGFMKSTKKLQQKLFKEIRSRIKEDDMSVPVKDGPYDYYTRTKKGKQYGIHCRKAGGKGQEEIILDENKLAARFKYFSLGDAEVSPDHRLLAYTFDSKGNEDHELRIKDLQTGELLQEAMSSVSDIVWAEDGEHMFYTKEEHPHPPRKVYRHRLGTLQSEDTLIYEEKDPQWYVSLGKSRSKDFIFIYAANYTTTEVRFFPSHQPGSEPQLIAPRRKEVRYYVEHHGDYFYITTNEKAVNYKIMRTPVQLFEKKNWKVWLAHDRTRAINGFIPFVNYIVLTLRENGSEEIYISSPEKEMYRIELPEGEHAIGVSSDIEYASPLIRLAYSSPVTPNTIFDYDVTTKVFTERKKQMVPGYKKEKFVTKREWVTSGSVRVPVVIVHKKGVRLNGKNPLLLEAYGSYGISIDPSFSVARLSLLDRGIVYALAHPRGGGEMGWQWHKAAYLTSKHRTADDFIAVAKYLIAKKYTSNEKMAITGGSAGGMLMGMVMNRDPELFKAALVYVPAADLLTSLLDEKLGGTRLHYDEIGNPNILKQYKSIMRISPYENVRALMYPTTLVRASAFDIRTPYWESAKWVARLRAAKVALQGRTLNGAQQSHKQGSTSETPLLFKCELNGGHFGKSGRYEWIKEKAFDYAFLIDCVKNS